METIKFNDSSLSYRYTPWDAKSFGVDTREIMSIEYQNEEDLSQLLSEFEKTVGDDALIYFRQDSNDQTAKKILFMNGYYIAEAALQIKLTKIKSIDFSKIYRNNLEIDDHINQDDIEQLQDIAYNSFNYSRFHEDPFLDIEKSRERYANWILDLVEQGKKVYVYRQNNEVISFQFYTLENNKVDLILGGSKEGYGMMTLYFFSTLMTDLQSKGVKRMDTMISSANLGILNTYVSFGYTVQKSFFDYHKIIKK
ncbi:MAG: hypothetical protein U9R26_00515 [Campylobacterota bacterium]|nr:hypothetical protein [Campylobacterota bacterium]